MVVAQAVCSADAIQSLQPALSHRPVAHTGLSHTPAGRKPGFARSLFRKGSWGACEAQAVRAAAQTARVRGRTWLELPVLHKGDHGLLNFGIVHQEGMKAGYFEKVGCSLKLGFVNSDDKVSFRSDERILGKIVR